jgi:hypothetical protein
VSGSSAGFGGSVAVAYDAATGGYTVHDSTGLSASFAAANKDTLASSTTASVFSKTTGNVNDQLVLFNPGAANPVMKLSYVSYGAWQRITDNGATANVAQQFFVYGIRQSSTAPSTGSASYATVVDGVWTNPDGIYYLGGSSTFTANFSSMTVATTLNLIGTNSVNGSNKTLGTFNGAGTIATLGGAFGGTFTHQGTDADGKTYSGGFNGAFFGPAGQEVGYTFSLTGQGGAVGGAVVGKAN